MMGKKDRFARLNGGFSGNKKNSNRGRPPKGSAVSHVERRSPAEAADASEPTRAPEGPPEPETAPTATAGAV
jgi:hypothetical protein